MTITQGNMEYQELLDLFYEAFEENENTDALVSTLVASTGLSLSVVSKAQAEASRLFAKYAR